MQKLEKLSHAHVQLRSQNVKIIFSTLDNLEEKMNAINYYWNLYLAILRAKFVDQKMEMDQLNVMERERKQKLFFQLQ